MSLADFVRKHVHARTRPSAAVKAATREANRVVNEGTRRRPPHLPDHRDLVNDTLADPPAWVIILDGGRFDLFHDLVDEYFDGDLRIAWNGGVGYTGDWFDRTLSGEYPDLGCFSWSPVRNFAGLEYDARDHFGVVPDINADRSAEQKLRDLGYLDAPDRDGENPTAESPRQVNQSVGEHFDDVAGGVIRYIKPHPPLTGLERMTTGAGKEGRVRRALREGDLSTHDLTAAYVDTYREGFEAAQQIVGTLPGDVVLTADHGTCLTCGQLFHGRNFEKHDHLCHVPWFEVDK